MSAVRRIGILGFGEAGSIFGAELARSGREVTSYDILLDSPATRQAMLARIERAGVRACGTAREAVAGTDLVICAVTAASAGAAAESAAEGLEPGQIFLDINSISPAAKRANEGRIAPTGSHYLDAAVMAPVPPQRLAVPMLLSAPRAAEALPALRSLGFNATVISDRVGVASAVKMCRSVVIKGLEALAVESLFAARRFGAEQEVLASLAQTFPQMGWEDALPDYLVSRVAEHGRRRAAEMREVARTLEDAGLEPRMALAASQCQQELIEAMGSHGIDYPRDRAFSWRALADALAKEGSR